MMTKEKDPEILCDLVVNGDVFHAGIDQGLEEGTRFGRDRSTSHKGIANWIYSAIPFRNS